MTSLTCGYTADELAAVGLSVTYGNPKDPETAGTMYARWGFDEYMCTTTVPLCDLWGDDAGLDDALLRLALAHHERAGNALGPGWEVRNDPKAGSVVLVWANWGVGCLEVLVDGGKTFVDTNGDSGVFELSPDLLAAIARAQLIAAALERVG